MRGFTRGEIIPVTIIVSHFEPFVLQKAIVVQLIRTIEIRTNKHVLVKEDILKTVDQDINVIGPYNFSQSLTCQHLIPTSTPPSIRYKDKVLRIRYKVRIRARLSKQKDMEDCTVEMPIVVGTWPRASIPIDDYDDDEIVMNMGNLMVDEDIHDGTIGSDSDSEVTSAVSIPFQRSGQVAGSDYSTSTHPSAPVIVTQKYMQDKNRVDRSDSMTSKSSNKSRGSVSSCPSSHIWDNASPLSQSASKAMNPSFSEQYQGSYMRGATIPGNIQNAGISSYPVERQDHGNRPTDSTLVANVQGIPHHDYVQDNRGSMISMYNHRHSISTYATAGPSNNLSRQRTAPSIIMNYPPPSYYQAASSIHEDLRQYSHNSPPPPPPPPYNPCRAGSEEFKRQLASPQSPSGPVSSFILDDDDVPTHVLQPLSTQLPSPPLADGFQAYDNATNRVATIGMASPVSATFPRKDSNYTYYSNATNEPTTASESSDDSDETDLFAIIEKKKKRRERWQ
ncbi:hypothetical protein EC973_005652 [Apophysomyces ossiformis]|uniref:Arrestin C-terminal-like domain-containing protein n=1 Tax=Apophysomyces ossiformis TaxID=679940 RepID=A0A8H7BP21_9FUNG|nr:hypothetical protein EC973_005652 [Apophysomyces ossiformis]